MSDLKKEHSATEGSSSQTTPAPVTQPLLDNFNIQEKGQADDTISELSSNPPKDKGYLVYGVMLLFGIAILLPWNIFITATDYFVNYKLNTNTSANANYRHNFVFYVGILGQGTNVIMNLINICLTFGGNPKKRIPYTFVLCSLVVLFHVFLAIINSYDWPFTFFVICCVSVFVMYVATGIMNSCVYYVASMFPMEYVNAIVIGNNLAGIFTTIMSILSKATSPNLRIAAIYYFVASFVVLMLGLIGYFAIHRTRFYRYFEKLSERNRSKNAQENEDGSTPKVPYLQIIKKIWFMLFCIWLNFTSTLAIFPVYQLGIQPSSPDFIVPSIWYQDILTFLTFNIIVTVGNMLPKLIKKPGPKWLPVPVIARAVIVFVFFAFCNFKPELRNHIPILIKNDYVYWAACILSPLSFGYFTSLLMMYTPTLVPPEHSGYASMMGALMITIGVLTGLQFTKVFELIVLL